MYVRLRNTNSCTQLSLIIIIFSFEFCLIYLRSEPARGAVPDGEVGGSVGHRAHAQVHRHQRTRAPLQAGKTLPSCSLSKFDILFDSSSSFFPYWRIFLLIFEQLADLGLMPRVAQQYTGDITIVPDVTFEDYCNIISNPTQVLIYLSFPRSA
jgi:hypothetical protein